MKTPLVTISCAFYNPGNLLYDMLKSIFVQTFQDWELVLVDDGSTDGSLNNIQSVNDSRVRVYSNGKNLGRSASLNRITELARGKYVARMDADDICSPQRIQKQLELIERNPDLDVVGTGVCYLDNQDRPVGENYAKVRHEEICRQPMRTFGLCHGSALGKYEWFRTYPYNETFRYAVDYNLWTSSYEHSCFGNVSEPLYYYRLDGSYSLKKQYIARKTSARFLYDHYRDDNRLKAFKAWGVQYAKFLATVAFCSLGARGHLLSKRYSPPAQENLKRYEAEIRQIKSMQLPLKTSEV